MKITLLFVFALLEAVQAVNKEKMWQNEQAMFFDGLDSKNKCEGAHSGAVSMNNPGCLRSEAARTCLFIGPDTYPRDWCLQKFDDDNCECQSMGVPLNLGPKSNMVLTDGPKSYSFRVGGCTNPDEWKCHK